MPTTFYLRSASTLQWLAGGDARLLSPTRGGGAVSLTMDTQVHSTAFFWDAGAGEVSFLSEPLNAVTLSGVATANLRGLESNAMANHALGNINWFRVSNEGVALGNIGFSSFPPTVELGTAESVHSFTATLTATIGAGERIGVRCRFYSGAGGTGATGYTVTTFWNGPTGGASGDAFVTFAETITEQGGGPPAVRVPYRNRMPSLIAQ